MDTLPSLVTLGALKTYIQINEENTEFDEPLLQLARVSTKALETYCRRSFAKKTYTEYFPTRNSTTLSYDLNGSIGNVEGLLIQNAAQRFPLKGFPVDTEAGLSVNYDIGRAFGNDTLLDQKDFYLNDAGNSLYILKGTASSPRGLMVTYEAGYETDEDGFIDAPEDLVLACVTQVMFIFNKMTENNIGVKGSKKHSPEYIQNPQMLCPEATAMAAPYRRSLVGKR